MDFKLVLFAFMALALTADTFAVEANTEDQTEDSTESPIADLAVLEPETSTERPTAAATTSQKAATAAKNEQLQNAQPHTVADFIIHPLIAFKPRSPEEDLAGKQADGSPSTTPSPWAFLGFNAGQGFGSSVSSLAGWVSDRFQLLNPLDSPIRGSTSTSTTTTTTTTQRPDVVVRVQHKASTRRPLISINNDNRPQRFHNNNNLNFASDEEDDEDLDYQFEEGEEINENDNKRRPHREEEDIDDQEEEDDGPVHRPEQKRQQQKRRRRPIVADDFSEEEEDDDYSPSAELDDEDEENAEDDEGDENDEEEEAEPQRPNTRRGSAQNNKHRWRQQPQRRRFSAGGKDQDAESNEIEEDDADEYFYYGSQSGRPSTKRSQNDATFFQRGQENIIKQLRQLTRGRTPAEMGALVRKSTKQAGSKQKRRQQATLLVNRNGQTIYLAPELLNTDLPLVKPQVQYLKQGATNFPQPPLTVPLKRKNAPTQYITIPWSQLGISAPDRLHAVTEGVQTQPLILNIPASAIQTMQNQSLKRKKQPVITAEAVPLLAEASIMDVFKPPKIPHDRHSTDVPAHKPSTAGMPVIIASKAKPSTGSNTVTSAILPQRIRPGTIVEKAPASADSQQEDSEDMSAPNPIRNVDDEYIFVGEDKESDLTPQVQPVYGEARYVRGANGSPYLELRKHGRFAVRRSGRELELQEAGEQVQQANGEQLIPVQIISEPEENAQPKEVQPVVETQPQHESQIAQSNPQKEVQQNALKGADAAVNVPVEENKDSEPVPAA